MERNVGYWLRRSVAAAIVATQLFLVVAAYDAPHPVFGFQMFPEASEWSAEIYRVTEVGERIDIREPWPGGYRWGDLVQGRGLAFPHSRHHADAGLRSTVSFLEHALDWVAANTPLDTETAYLEAVVTTWHNNDAPSAVVLVSEERRP